MFFPPNIFLYKDNLNCFFHVLSIFFFDITGPDSFVLSSISLFQSDIAESIKSVCCTKSEGAVDHTKITKWFKKFPFGCKKLNNQLKSGWPKTVDSKAIF